MRQPRKSSTKKLPKKLSHINQRHFARAFPRLVTRGSPYEKPLYSSRGCQKKPCQSHELNPPFNDTTRHGDEGANTGDINVSFSKLPALSAEPQYGWDQLNVYQQYQYPMDPRALKGIELGDCHHENPAWDGVSVSVQGFGYNLQDPSPQMSIDDGTPSVWQRYQQDNSALWEVESNDGMFGVQHPASTPEATNHDQWYPDHYHQVNEYWPTSPAVSSDAEGSIMDYSYFTPTPFSGVDDNYFSL